jgi:hypothetical protein
MAKAKQEVVISRETPYEDACKIMGYEPLTADNFSFLPEDQRDYMHSKHRIVTVLDARKKGRQFNYNNRNEYKHFPWWDMETYNGAVPGSGFVLLGVRCDRTFTFVGARLSSFSEADARFVADVMEKDYRIIMK